MENKKGLLKLGLIGNLKRNEKNENCITNLSKKIKKNIRLEDLDEFIESQDFKIEYLNSKFQPSEKINSYRFRFKLPWCDKNGLPIYGHFSRKDIKNEFYGVKWGTKNLTNFRLDSIGDIEPSSWQRLSELVGKDITKTTIYNYIHSDLQFYNGAGHTQFRDGTSVTKDNAKFIVFNTSLFCGEEQIRGWFIKGIKNKFEGITWGTESDFKKSQEIREKFFVGRLIFDSLEECNKFLERVKENTIEEPWEFTNRKDNKYKYPILKSYLEFELSRLFYESEELSYSDKIIFNQDKSKILYNTNLINTYGDDLTITGDVEEHCNKVHICNPEINVSKLDLIKMKFDTKVTPKSPEFFKEINEIIFYSEWDIDLDIRKCEHIIDLRRDRFPIEYKDSSSDELANKLKSAIMLAQKIAQRNYKFIVPMYYPTLKRIQLLMPIYLKNSYNSHPDFALVLTPHEEHKLYTPETILELDEVYQDARLIAKPDESWLNPLLIK